jgi:hypothetical protein
MSKYYLFDSETTLKEPPRQGGTCFIYIISLLLVLV